MKKSLTITKSSLIFLTLIISLGVFLRFYKLNQVPHGLYWDEAAIAYNAWSIAVWNRDEWGQKLPVSFRSFGDYKSPAFIYLLGLTYKITGLQINLVRMYPALFGIANIILIYSIAKALDPKSRSFPLLSALFMAITPWAIHFSRIGVEAQLALTLSLLGMALVLYHESHPLLRYAGAASFAFSLYAYHNAKIVTPLLLIVLAVYLFRTQQIKSYKTLIIPCLVFFILIAPLAYDTVFGEGFERGKALIFFENGSLSPANNILNMLGVNLGSYLHPGFWVKGEDVVGLRHSVQGYGITYISIFMLVLTGILRAIISRQKVLLFFVFWLGIGMLPAVISQGNPHAIRSLQALPAIMLIAAHTGNWVLEKLINRPTYLFLSLISAFFILLTVELTNYVTEYFGPYAKSSAFHFQFGYKEALEFATQEKDSVEKIIITSRYGQPYIYTLLHHQITPQNYWNGALNFYEFRPIDWPKDFQPNQLYLAAPEEISPQEPEVIEVIFIPGTITPVFVIAKT
jgi:hypothetical protein